MIKTTSIQTDAINYSTNFNSNRNDIVLELFKQSPAGLTTTELIRNYDLFVESLPASTAIEKSKISGKHNGIKASRTDLTHKGYLKVQGERTCSITGRNVQFFVYTGIELSAVEQLKAEKARKEEEVLRYMERIQEIELILKALGEL
jgi:hypothetical protein